MDQVSKVLSALGLKPVERDDVRRTIVFSGPASAAAAAFKVELTQYTIGGKSFRGLEGGVHIPAELEGLVEGVFGLDERPQNEPRLRRFTETAAEQPSRAVQTLSLPSTLSRLTNFHRMQSELDRPSGSSSLAAAFLTAIPRHFSRAPYEERANGYGSERGYGQKRPGYRC